MQSLQQTIEIWMFLSLPVVKREQVIKTALAEVVIFHFWSIPNSVSQDDRMLERCGCLDIFPTLQSYLGFQEVTSSKLGRKHRLIHLPYLESFIYPDTGTIDQLAPIRLA